MNKIIMSNIDNFSERWFFYNPNKEQFDLSCYNTDITASLKTITKQRNIDYVKRTNFEMLFSDSNKETRVVKKGSTTLLNYYVQCNYK